jgi:phenylalanyl-tRNA synthetase alpha chain
MTAIVGEISSLPKAERPAMGKAVNGAKVELVALLDEKLEGLRRESLANQLGPTPDFTLSSRAQRCGCRHPLAIVRDRIVEIFRRMGFSVATGTEIESEWVCFDALNMGITHAARDSMDTFFLPESLRMANVRKHGTERFLLRTHMTTVQVRSLLSEKLPLRVIAPGRVFRRDTTDATHSANFHQCDVVHVDRKVSVGDLRATIDFLLRELFGDGVEIRYRPSFFPFTEPSFEVDLRHPRLGSLSNRWLEVLGSGMIHPNVFRAVGIDPDEWSGQAWGLGIERMAMLLFGVDDVRHFYRNDMRFLRQFTPGA